LGLGDLTFIRGLNSTELLEKREKFSIVCSSNCSFESDAWSKSNLPNPSTCCFLLSGYIAGWVEQSLGISITCVETACRLSKSPSCQFLISHTHHTEPLLTDINKDNICVKIHKYSSFQAIYNGNQDVAEILYRPYPTDKIIQPRNSARSKDTLYHIAHRSQQSPKSISPPPRKTDSRAKLLRHNSFDSPRYQQLQGKKKEKKKSLKRKQSKEFIKRKSSKNANTLARTITAGNVVTNPDILEARHQRVPSEPSTHENIKSLVQSNHEDENHSPDMPEETDKRKSRKKKVPLKKKESQKNKIMEKKRPTEDIKQNSQPQPISPCKTESPPLRYSSTDKVTNLDPDDTLSKSKKRISKRIRLGSSTIMTQETKEKKI